MLSEDQAAELLKRCESIVGKTLKQVRGNLKKAETRASAVWELLVLEEASNIGQMVEYEPITDGKCPDILLTLKNRRKIWIEVAFLHPRFGKEERKTEDVRKWIQEEAKKQKYLSL